MPNDERILELYGQFYEGSSKLAAGDGTEVDKFTDPFFGNGDEAEIRYEDAGGFTPLTHRQRWAMALTSVLLEQVELNFGLDSGFPRRLEWNDSPYQDFLIKLGRSMRAIIDPESPFSKDAIDHQVDTHQALERLFEWGETVTS